MAEAAPATRTLAELERRGAILAAAATAQAPEGMAKWLIAHGASVVAAHEAFAHWKAHGWWRSKDGHMQWGEPVPQPEAPAAEAPASAEAA